MIVSLKDYVIETTPFLSRVLLTGEPAGLKGVGKFGRGPTISEKYPEAKAVEAERFLISSCIDSWVRGQLYLFACHYGFKPIEGCGCSVVPQISQRYPLRAGEDGKPVNPMLVVENLPVVNPEWTVAPKEFFFGFDQDVLKLDGNVSRALREDHYAFKIELRLHIPRGSVCVELRPRVPYENN